MAAAKSALGHAETGAGAVGIAQAALQLGQNQQLPLTHLRLLNPYVLNTFEAEAKQLHQSGPSAGDPSALSFPNVPSCPSPSFLNCPRQDVDFACSWNSMLFMFT